LTLTALEKEKVIESIDLLLIGQVNETAPEVISGQEFFFFEIVCDRKVYQLGFTEEENKKEWYKKLRKEIKAKKRHTKKVERKNN